MPTKQKIYNMIYQGMMLFGRVGKRCRICYRQGQKFLIEFEDKRRDWCFYNELVKIPDNPAKIKVSPSNTTQIRIPFN